MTSSRYLPQSLRRHAAMVDAILELTLWLVAAMILPGKADMVLFAAAAGMAAVGTPLRGLQMLTVQTLLLHFNPTLVGWEGSGGLHLLLPFILLGKVLMNPAQFSFFTRDTTLQVIALIAPFFIGYQVLFSTFPGLSISKAVLFFVNALVVLFLSKWCFRRSRAQVIQWYLGAVLFLILASLPLLVLPHGFFKNGAGFNGILLHPNALGIVLGVGLAYLLAHVVASRRISWPMAMLGVIGLIEVYLTQSRGGLFTCVLSLAVFVGLKVASGASSGSRLMQRAGILLVAVIPVLLVTSDAAYEAASGFLTKSRGDEASLTAVFEDSRGAAIDLHLDLFKEKPLTGHGFQVVNAWSSEGFIDASLFSDAGLVNESMIEYDPIMKKIPISAPVESGFMYTSILAENGILGGLLAYGVMLAIAYPILMGPKHGEFHLLVAVLLVNISEATFFSQSGLGGWTWLMLGLAYASATVPPNPKQRRNGIGPRRRSRPPLAASPIRKAPAPPVESL